MGGGKGKGKGGSSVGAGQLMQDQAQLNRITQFTPQGNIIFGGINEDGSFSPSTGDKQAASVIEESPFNRQIRQGSEDISLLLQNTAAPRLQNLPLAPIDTSQFPERQFGIDFSQIDQVPSSSDFSQDALRQEQATFGRAMNLLQPQFDRQQDTLTQSLANRGLPTGSEAFRTESQDLNRDQGNLLENLALSSVGAGRSEQGRLFSQGLAGRSAQLNDQLQNANLANTARAQTLQEQQSLRSGELAELMAILGLQPAQAIGLQNFFAPAGIDVTGPASIAANQQAASDAQNQQFMNGLFGLGSSVLGGMAFSGAFT